MEYISEISGIFLGIMALIYTHRAHKHSMRAPSLKLAFCHPDTTKPFSVGSDPRRPARFVINAAYNSTKKNAPEGSILSFPLPFIIRNHGTITAKNITVHARYGSAWSVKTDGKQIEDGDRPEWVVVEHSLPDLHPKQTHTYKGDEIAPAEELVNGIFVDVPATTKDGIKIIAKTHVRMASYVQVVVYCENCEPIIRELQILFKDPK